MATLQNLNFVPTSVSGCTLWLDAADPNTLSGIAVSSWRDKSGVGNNASSSSPPTQGTYNGYPVVNFNGSSQFMTSSNTIPYTTHTLIAVHRPAVINGNNQGNTSLFRYQVSSSPYVVFPYMAGTTPSGYITTAGTLSNLVENSVTTSFNIIIASIASGSQIIYKNGTQQSQASAALSGATSPSLMIGSYVGTAEFYQGSLAEMLVYSSNITNTNRQSIEGYLAWKWGLQGSLPSNHPFKLIAPNSSGLVYPSQLSIPVQVQAFLPNSNPLVLFNPRSISGCLLWLDAADVNAVVLGSGSNISRVLDKSPQNLTLTGATSFTYDTANRAFTATGGTGPILGTATFSVPTPASIFVVGQMTAGYFFDGISSISRMAMLWNGSQYIGTQIDTTPTFPITGTNPYATRSIIQGVFNGASSILYRNGTSIATPSLQSLTATGLTIGARFNTTEALNGTINEFLVFNSELTTVQRQQMEGYLAWKWGLQASLPSNHPFRNTVPGLTINVSIPILSMQPGSFRPTQISGNSLWLDGADVNGTGIQPINGSPLSSWIDKSGNGRNATQATSAQQPSYSSNAITFVSANSNVLNMSDAYNMLNTSGRTYTFFVVERRGSSNSTQFLFAGSAANNALFFGYNTNTLVVHTAANVSDTTYTIAGWANPDPIRIWGGGYNGSVRNLVLNGTEVAFGAYTGGAIASWSNASLGYIPLSGVLTYYTGVMYEILFYNSYLSLNQRQSIEGYLAWKWGLQGNLPNNHPFKRFPPPPI